MSDGISDAFKDMRRAVLDKIVEESQEMGLYDEPEDTRTEEEIRAQGVPKRNLVSEPCIKFNGDYTTQLNGSKRAGNDVNQTVQITSGNNGGEVVLTEGTKYDAGKPMLDLVPASLEEAVGEILTMGAKKYERNNWKKGINYSRIVASLKRHLNEFYKGNLIDNESGKPHIWHAACNLAFLIEFESQPEKYKNFNDIHGNDK